MDRPAKSQENTALPSQTDTEQVVARLRTAIIEGTLSPNQRLPELELAQKLGCGRLTVRSALLALEKEGLVVREPNRGARVRDIPLEEVMEVTEARMALEGLLARKAATRLTDETAQNLLAIIAEMETVVAAGDLLRYSELNRKLHRAIREVVGAHIIRQLLEQLDALMARFQFRLALVPGRAQQSLAQHRALVEALVARDPQEAERRMREHLESVHDTLTRLTPTTTVL